MIRKTLLLAALLAAGYASLAQTAQSPADRIGYANVDYIISRLPDMKQMQTELKSTETQLRNQIEARTREVEKQYNDFTSSAESMVDSVRMKKQRELEEAIAGLEDMQQNAQVTLQNKQKLIMAPIYLKVNSAISQVAKENGYAMILTERVDNYPFILYHGENTDVSALVLAKLGVTAPEE